jgi:hypothetical protein
MLIVTLENVYEIVYNNEAMEDEMGRTCSTLGGEEECM